jgi:hypothetical protein
MIKFSKKISDLNTYLKEMLLALYKSLMIIELIFIPFIIYFFLVGFFVNKEAFLYGCSILGIFVINLLKILKMFILFKKNLKIYFKDINNKGEIEFSIYLEYEEYVIENITTKKTGRIKKDEIKFITKSKNCIFIKTTNEQIFFFPRTSALTDLFSIKKENNVVS